MDTNPTPGVNGPPQGGTFPAGGPPSGFRGGRGGALMFLGPFGGIIAIGLLVLTYVIMAIAMYQFLKKAGLTPWIAILMLLPVVNLGVALWAAFTSWPVLKEVERLKMLVATSQLMGAETSGQSAADGEHS